MATVEVLLRDGQRLGFVQMRDGSPYYGYAKWEATEMTLDEAKNLARRIAQDKYHLKIHINKNEREVNYKPYEIVVD